MPVIYPKWVANFVDLHVPYPAPGAGNDAEFLVYVGYICLLSICICKSIFLYLHFPAFRREKIVLVWILFIFRNKRTTNCKKPKTKAHFLYSVGVRRYTKLPIISTNIKCIWSFKDKIIVFYCYAIYIFAPCHLAWPPELYCYYIFID